MGGAASRAAEALDEDVADRQLEAIRRGHRPVHLVDEAPCAGLARAHHVPFESHVADATLREAMAVNFEPIPELDRAWRDVGHVDERRGNGPMTPHDQEQEDDETSQEAHALRFIKDPSEARDFSTWRERPSGASAGENRGAGEVHILLGCPPMVFAVIMAGGAGTRFWPASRASRPKQLLPLAGGEPLLAATVRRLAPLLPPDRVFVVTGEHLAEATAQAVPGARVLREPAPRNTAPCIAWANAVIAGIDPEAVVMVLPSDHFIADEHAFVEVLRRAVRTAETGRVTTIGIVPTRPETGYGYIELGEANGEAHRVQRFVEKPDRARAEAFVAAGPTKYLWNAGMFFFRVKDMQALLERHLPEVAAGVARMVAAGGSVAEVFPTLQSISIDHGVMEKAENLAVVPGRFGWNDIGSWQSAWELAPKDDVGNAVGPSDLALDARNNLVRSTKPVALVGVDDLVVVETADAILVLPRDRSQDVRLVIDALKKAGRTDLL